MERMIWKIVKWVPNRMAPAPNLTQVKSDAKHTEGCGKLKAFSICFISSLNCDDCFESHLPI